MAKYQAGPKRSPLSPKPNPPGPKPQTKDETISNAKDSIPLAPHLPESNTVDESKDKARISNLPVQKELLRARDGGYPQSNSFLPYPFKRGYVSPNVLSVFLTSLCLFFIVLVFNLYFKFRMVMEQEETRAQEKKSAKDTIRMDEAANKFASDHNNGMKNLENGASVQHI